MNDLKLLGLRVRDKVTGVTGIVESICYDLYGCIQALVRSPVVDKGVIPDARWFDVSRLDVVDASPVMEVPGNRFAVARSGAVEPSQHVPGPCEKPAR